MSGSESDCVFCRIARGEATADRVLEDDRSVAFLDTRPVFVGHVLLIPKQHVETFADLPRDLVAPFFQNGQRLARALEDALSVDGTFVAMNNKVSQSVPHLHLHLVPRKKKDGLRGFFWPRQRYESEEVRRQIAARIADAVVRASQS
jgi:histidine triad (HIT) family protein